MNTTLYLQSEHSSGERATVPLQPDNCLFVGAGSGCHIQLAGADISAIHCMIWMESDGVVHVQDRNMVGKTTLNGQPVENATIGLGDELLIGPYQLSLSTTEAVSTNKFFHRDSSGSESEPEANAAAAHESEPELAVPAEEPSIDVADSEWTTTDFDLGSIDDGDVQDVNSEAVEEDAISNEVANNPPSTSTDATSSVDEGWDFDSVDESDSWGAFDADPAAQSTETEMLRMEVEQLRIELAERDAQLAAGQQDSTHEAPLNPSDTEKLVTRLEELLDELQESDERIQHLEELLRLSDSATQAEQQERVQLENWVAEIEGRVRQKEAEAEAELERAQQQLQNAQTRISDLETRLETVLNSDQQQDQTVVKEFQQQLERVQSQVEQANEENALLKRQLQERPEEVRSAEEFEALEQKIMQMEVETSRERAEMARQRVELERLKHELETTSKSQGDLEDSNSRVRAMRLHLREVHEQEMQEKRERSLGARISRLFARTTKP